MTEPGELLASGRDADIFAIGSDRVLRRSRNGTSLVHEARIIEYVREQGYPAPRVFEVSDDGLELVMARVDGPTMVDRSAAQPWRIRRLGAQLAELHESLHRLDAPEWLHDARVGRGRRIVHMDLHPLNVLMSPDGPVVIDWTNAAAGDPMVDVAATWILLESGELPAKGPKALLLGVGRRIFLRSFLAPFDPEALGEVLADVVEWKCQDPNMSAAEVGRMRALVTDAVEH